MDKQKYSWSGKGSREAGNAVSERVPTEASWGYYGCYYNAGCCSWFESWVELLEFIGEHEVNLGDQSDGDVNPDLEEARAGVRKIVADLLAGRLSAAEGLTQLNTALDESGSQIRWWGQVGELLEGSDEFAEDLRSRFRDDEGPINRAELGEFLEFLKSFDGYRRDRA
jgi:hypothetical protein